MPSWLRMLLSLSLLLTGCAGGSLAPSPTHPPGPAATLRPTATPTSASTLIHPPTFDPFWVTSILCAQNVYSNRNPGQGRPARFLTPIAINPNSIPAVLDAIALYERAFNGLITFTVVDQDPPVGIVVDLGDAIRQDGTPGCGNVTNGPDPASGHRFMLGADGAFNTTIYIHLGTTPACRYAVDGYPYPIAEHELAHALGLAGHFDGFTGDEGLSLQLIAVLAALYRLAPGADLSSACPPR